MAEIQYIAVGEIWPHPNNPRKDLGDLKELADSIKANGILQNLTVIPRKPEGYTVLIGHRRLAAAKLAGLDKVPCVVTTMTEKEQLATMLMENIQRSDLTVYEQAQGFQMMLDLGDTVQNVAKSTGFSESTIRRRVKLLELDQNKFREAEGRGATLAEYMELDKLEDPEMKNKVLEAIGTINFRNVLKSAVAEEHNKKLIDKWTRQAEAFAVRVKEVDYSTMTRYVYRDIWSDTDNNDIEKPEDAGEVKYYFWHLTVAFMCTVKSRLKRNQTRNICIKRRRQNLNAFRPNRRK